MRCAASPAGCFVRSYLPSDAAPGLWGEHPIVAAGSERREALRSGYPLVDLRPHWGHHPPMSTATITSSGQLAIPSKFRRALHLTTGAKVVLSLDGGKLIVQPSPVHRASLVDGEFGRPVLKASPDAPPMTPEQVKAILEEAS